MTSFGEWLKQIVVIVLLSSIADLLLPTKAMQKYVRAVLGLAIIAAMIQPITPFFRYNWADQLSTVVSSELDGKGKTPMNGSSYGNSSNQALADTVKIQEEDAADMTVADSVLASLDSSLRSAIVSLKVANALTPKSLMVTVQMRRADAPTIDKITTQIETLLNISRQQIVVENGGR